MDTDTDSTGTTGTGDVAAEQPAATGGPEVQPPRVVVGVDGSPGARAALVAALLAAARRGAVLDVVSAFPTPLVWTGGSPVEVPDTDAVRADTESRARDLVDEVRREESLAGVPGVAAVDVRVLAVAGHPVPALIQTATGADLLVVGSRGRGAMRSALLGSVALHCASHAPCPVLVVHPQAPAGQPPRVVVGVDGSTGARAAVAEAVEEALRSGSEVDAVASYAETDYWTDMSTVVVPSVQQIRDDLRHRTEDTVEAVLHERPADRPVPTIRTSVVEGPAGEVLVEQSNSADLLVVGSRGRGRIRGLLLGSVALHCAMHAHCPVLVVHPQRATSPVAQAVPEPAMAGR